MKFAVHHHITGCPHYDFMLEGGSSLKTWRIPENSIEPLLAGNEVEAVRLPDHRKKYLAYEGPVSGGRGRVEFLDRGDYHRDSGGACILKGDIFRGKLFIKDGEAEDCSIFFFSPS